MSSATSGKGRQAKQPRSLPSGTVTFLFSDIEGSTERWEAYRKAMKAAVARHDELMRAAIERYGGYVFKTVGDAFCAAFSDASHALHAALDAHVALAREDFSAVDALRVRMGLHTGSAEERDADYFGPAVNRVARLMSIGHGGQLLLSGITHELVHNDAKDVMFSDLGLHRLKDLAEPERVWQANISGLQRDFPPLNSLDILPNNLPVQVTSFIGRERDLEDLKAHVAKYRLVTLFGAGGVGKTRLAAQAGAELLDHFSDGVWIADFAPITDPGSVTSVIAQVLGVSQTHGHLHEAICQWLKGKELLLVLDSCEHVLEAAATFADAITRTCPNVRIVATSRQVLGLAGEKVVHLACLTVPDKAARVDSARAMDFGAVALFVDRASLVNQSFCLNDDNAPIVADICRRLDGIPLAIELAAARVKVLSVAHLDQRLNERFKILTAGSRTALPRQKTLSALIDWSYDLLSEQERRLFNQVSSFAGSFTIDAASFVCCCPEIPESEIFDLIASLADKSLVAADTTGSQERYRLLESMREYALEKLTAGGERENVTRRHAEYFLAAAQTAERNFNAMPLSGWLGTLEPEVENFRATLEWALGAKYDIAVGATLASALEMFWWHGGLEAEGRRWVEMGLHRINEGAYPDIADRLRRTLTLLTSRVLFS
jgi:predicted ATPase/class 3 adenylate cyclase